MQTSLGVRHAFPSPRMSADSNNHFRSSTVDQSEAVFQLWVNLCLLLKNITRDKMADLNAVFGHVCEMVGIRELNAYQREAIVQFVQKKTDVFVNLPTGYGKSLIYQAVPFVYDTIFEAAGQYCCCGFAACKSYERPGRQSGKSWNSCRFSQ